MTTTINVVCGSDISLNYSESTQSVSLTCSANSNTANYLWRILSVPTGSTALSETRGDFINGTASVQNPTFTTDASIAGTYCIQCTASNENATSNPLVDKENGQQNIIIKTNSLSLSLPNNYQWNWGDYNTNNFNLLEDAIGESSSYESPLTTKGDLLTYSTDDARLAVGAANRVLVTDSSSSTGLNWSTGSYDFHDDFNNSSLDSRWTEDIPTVGTVTENDSQLIIGHTGGTQLDWWSGNFNAPGIYRLLEPRNFITKIYFSNMVATSLNMAAIIFYIPGAKASNIRISVGYHTSSYVIDSSYNSTGGSQTTIGQNYCWIAIVRNVYYFHIYYSTNNLANEPNIQDMTLHRTIGSSFTNPITIYPKLNIGLYSLISGSLPATSIYYNKFSLIY